MTHEAMEDFTTSTGNINNIVKRAQEMTKKYNDVFMNGIEKNLVCKNVSMFQLNEAL